MNILDHKNCLKATAVLMGMTSSAACFSTETVENPFHMYLRSGVGASMDGGDQVCFKAAGAPAKYRLGNECETYAAIRLGKTFKTDDDKTFKVLTDVIYTTDQSGDYEALNESKPDQMAIRRFNVSATNVIEALPGATVWVGKEHIDRQNVHINDFFYWDPKGPGVGIKNVDVGFARLGLSWLRNNSVDLDSNADGSLDGNYVNNTYDIRLSDISLTDKISTQVGLTMGTTSGTDSDGFSYSGANNSGMLMTLNINFADVLGGSNKLTIQKARDGMIASQGTGNQNGTLEGDFFRIINSGLASFSDTVDAQYVVIYEDKNQDTFNGVNGTQDFAGHTWISAGVRPVLKWGNYTSTAFEVGYDRIEDKLSDETNSMTKLTVAQQFSLGSSFFSRPALRFFATYATWDKAGQHANSGGILPADSTSGLSFGAQTEVWF
ncbi:maltoporin [Oceanobacter kriegii]|uniref:maltoporin n=1 Tax=Oceanobacter kriegii TaxID=64972 RepID=UPI000428B42F|nr:carbohydrate porin [Oceanobacter kriegii]